MYVAQIRKKLTRPEEDMEDLLTSNVFGLWRYIPYQLGLTQFLETSRRLDGEKFTLPGDIEFVGLTFWPWLKEEGKKGAQPDVLIEIRTISKGIWLILIESKYLSGKSSLRDDKEQEPTDQLAREMNNLRRISGQRNIENYALIYITADTIIPRREIEESIDELVLKTGNSSRGRFFWTTWRRLPSILYELKMACMEPFSVMLSDLHTIICRLNLTLFEDVTYDSWSLPKALWKFTPEARVFRWKEIIIPDIYSFRLDKPKFKWESITSIKDSLWRWKENG